MTFKVFILGSSRVGKTELISQLVKPGYTIPPNKQYKMTIGADFLTITNEDLANTLQIWDSAGDLRFRALSNALQRGTAICLYCIDLSESMNEKKLDEIRANIIEFKTQAEDAVFILVGTKSDKTVVVNLETVRKQLSDATEFLTTMSTSARTENSSKELYNLLISQAKKKEALQHTNSFTNDLIKARNRCHRDSDLYKALDNLNQKAMDLPFNIMTTLGNEANILIDKINDGPVIDKAPYINAFIENSYKALQDENHGIKSAIMAVAITAVLAVVAGLIGFAIGFALGAWTGPGALVTGLVVGATAVSSVAVGYTAHRFYKPSPAMESIDEIAEIAHKMV